MRACCDVCTVAGAAAAAAAAAGAGAGAGAVGEVAAAVAVEVEEPLLPEKKPPSSPLLSLGRLVHVHTSVSESSPCVG